MKSDKFYYKIEVEVPQVKKIWLGTVVYKMLKNFRSPNCSTTHNNNDNNNLSFYYYRLFIHRVHTKKIGISLLKDPKFIDIRNNYNNYVMKHHKNRMKLVTRKTTHHAHVVSSTLLLSFLNF